MNEPSDNKTLPCKDKLTFDNKNQADGSAVAEKWRSGTELKSYLCRYCHLWHLATKVE